MQEEHDKICEERFRIRLVDYGLANRYSEEEGEIIEINKELKNFPQLYRAVLEHEKKHSPGRYGLKDLKLDLYDGIKKPGKWKFIFKHPSSWVQFFPIWYSKRRGFVMDLGNLSNSLVFFVMLWIVIKLFLRFV